VVTCTPGKAKKGKVTVSCGVKLAAKATANVSARFMSGRQIAATGSGKISSKTHSVQLDPVQLAPGSYTLVLTYVIAGRRATLHQNVRVKRRSPAPRS
jgi:hypothetical protein